MYLATQPAHPSLCSCVCVCVRARVCVVRGATRPCRYTTLVDPELTCYEPEAPGVLVTGLDFHKFYFDLPKSPAGAVRPQTTLVDQRVTLLGAGAALMTYTRLTQAVASSSGAPYTQKSEETRVWKRAADGRWVCAHFHRSGAPSAPSQ
jgi:calcium/calmodulin-dependent protein kinase (CaM kinase) II